MEAYIMRDTDPDGGYLAITRAYPVISDQKKTVVEVRKCKFPADKFLQLMFGEIASDPETLHDKILEPYFKRGEVCWTREGGVVIGSDTV